MNHHIGEAQKTELTSTLAEIRNFDFHVSFNVFSGEHELGDTLAFALSIRDLVVRLQRLAAPILPVDIAGRLDSIHVDEHDFMSASRARAELDALVPIVEDALTSLDSRPDALLTGSLRQLLQARDLNPVSKDVERALLHVENDPSVAITASRAALEALFKVYIEDKKLPMPSRPNTGNLLKVAMDDLGLDPADKTDETVKCVLQSLRSVVHGIANLRTQVGSAHGHGRRLYRLQARHARLAVQASQTVIEFFVETWNHQEGRSSSD